MMSLWQGALLAFVCMNVGLLMELYCPQPPQSESWRDTGKESNVGKLCRQNGSALKWFAGIALCVLVAYGAYRYVKTIANAK